MPGDARRFRRGLSAVSRESHMDDLAHAVGIDPLEFRLKNLSDNRLRAVLQAAAEEFGWNKSRAVSNRGYGLACSSDKGSYMATCAEVEQDPTSGAIRVVRLANAFECGAIVNPEHLKNQVDGAVVMGLGGALFDVGNAIFQATGKRLRSLPMLP